MRSKFTILLITLSLSTANWAQEKSSKIGLISANISQLSAQTALLLSVFTEESLVSSSESTSEASDGTSSVNIKKRKMQRSFFYKLSIVSGEIARQEMDSEYLSQEVELDITLSLIKSLSNHENSADKELYIKLFGKNRLKAITSALNSKSIAENFEELEPEEKNSLIKFYIGLENQITEDIIL